MIPRNDCPPGPPAKEVRDEITCLENSLLSAIDRLEEINAEVQRSHEKYRQIMDLIDDIKEQIREKKALAVQSGIYSEEVEWDRAADMVDALGAAR